MRVRRYIHFVGGVAVLGGITAGEGRGDGVNFITTILVNTLIIGIVDDIICEEAFFTAVAGDANATAIAIITMIIVVAIDAGMLCS